MGILLQSRKTTTIFCYNVVKICVLYVETVAGLARAFASLMTRARSSNPQQCTAQLCSLMPEKSRDQYRAYRRIHFSCHLTFYNEPMDHRNAKHLD